MPSMELKTAVNDYERYIAENGINEDVIHAMYQAAETAMVTEGDVDYALELTKRTKSLINEYLVSITGGDIWAVEEYAINSDQKVELVDKYYDILRLESYDVLESFIRYMERYRSIGKRFYQPREKTLGVVVQDLQDLEDRKFEFYGLSLPSRTGKSTTCIFFLAWIAMKRPNSHSAMGGHSGVLAKGFHKELLNLITTAEYAFDEIYSFWHSGHTLLRDKSAEDLTIVLDEPDRFATITCRGIDGTWTGAIDVSKDGYLYVDDLVRDREHSLSPYRMENTYQEYQNKMVDRKNDGARELMVGTLWNVLDPLERMRVLHEGDPRYRFRKIPALDENDESNFQYAINGFSTEYYKDMRDRLDNAEWMAKYQQQPYVREGILFQSDELRYFNGILPDGDSRVVAVTDVAWGAGDAVSMPIGREYENGEIYIFDWVFNRGAKEVTLPIVSGKIMENGIQEIRFEANNGGSMYCEYVDEILRSNGYKCSCTWKKSPGNLEKGAKIQQYSGDIKRKFIFLQSRAITPEEREEDLQNGVTRYERSREYQAAMDELTTYVVIGKNEHDDAADSLSQLALFIENPTGLARVEAMRNPFSGGF